MQFGEDVSKTYQYHHHQQQQFKRGVFLVNTQQHAAVKLNNKKTDKERKQRVILLSGDNQLTSNVVSFNNQIVQSQAAQDFIKRRTFTALKAATHFCVLPRRTSLSPPSTFLFHIWQSCFTTSSICHTIAAVVYFYFRRRLANCAISWSAMAR